MLLPVMFFVAIVCAAATLGLALMMTRRKRLEVERRLSLLPFASPSLEANGPFGIPARPKAARLARLERLLLLDRGHPWELETSSAKLAVVALASAAAGWFVCRRFLYAPMPLSAAAAALTAYFAMRLFLLREQRRMALTFAAQFPDAVDAVARVLRAGLPVTAAFQMVSLEAPVPVKAVFATLAGQLRIGMPIEDALRLSSERIRLADFQFFAIAVLLQQSAGGNLLSTLDALAQMMRNRRAMQLKARAATAEVRFSAYVLGALPFVTVAALLVVSPDYLAPLFIDPRGRGVLGAAAAGLFISAFASPSSPSESATTLASTGSSRTRG